MTMGDVLGTIGTRSTPQTEKAAPEQVENSAGGFVFGLDDWGQLDRFLILGVSGGTFYANERSLALDNVEVIDRCLDADHVRTIDRVVEISEEGRAMSNDPALYVLARASGHTNIECRQYALARLQRVARIGTHLFHFVNYAKLHRGWGRALTDAVAAWYLDKPVDALAYQTIKYRQRDGWSHRDVLRQAHPVATTPEQNSVLRFAAGKPAIEGQPLARAHEGFTRLQEASDPDEAAALVREYVLPWEAVPSELLTGDKVWRALLAVNAMPPGALLRNLGVLTNRGVIAPGSSDTVHIAGVLTDPDAIKRARLHPIAILNALVTYKGGTSKGGVTWAPNREIVNALDTAFYASFGNVDRSDKRFMLALDVSGSMDWQPCSGAAFTPRVGAAAMAMVTDSASDNAVIAAFSAKAGVPGRGSGIESVDISCRRRLDDNLRQVNSMYAGATDCALPMVWAKAQSMEIDTFVVYTDNETYAGRPHPHQALADYRRASGIEAKLIVVGMTATGFTIADPRDPGMLDVVGFDTATPQAISAFAG
jgi:60 kDa SS-A/Ro ribonucleoprotein